MSGPETTVSILAYELWELAGRPEGRDEEFWFAAEAKLQAPDTKSEDVVDEAPAPEPEAETPERPEQAA